MWGLVPHTQLQIQSILCDSACNDSNNLYFSCSELRWGLVLHDDAAQSPLFMLCYMLRSSRHAHLEGLKHAPSEQCLLSHGLVTTLWCLRVLHTLPIEHDNLRHVRFAARNGSLMCQLQPQSSSMTWHWKAIKLRTCFSADKADF